MIKKILKIKRNEGFVILFAVTIASILLAIAIGITNIALKEIKFGTSAKDANEAFFAADTGLERAFWNDSSGEFKPYIYAADPDFDPNVDNWSNNQIYLNLGSEGKSCVSVEILRTPQYTTMTSRGYSVTQAGCYVHTAGVERVIQVTY